MPVSYRASLTKIGIPPTAAVSYQGFASRPRSLRRAIRSMDAPAADSWRQVADVFRDDDWTDEVQGVAWDGGHWLFSANANQDKPGHEDKALYVFKGGDTLSDGNWKSRVKFTSVPPPIGGTTESDHHWGQLTFFDGRVYVAHFWYNDQTHLDNAVVFKDTDGALEFEQWIELEQPTSPTDQRTDRAEFQAINPWDGMIYSCFGGGDIHEFFIHERTGPRAGRWTGRALTLNPPVRYVQGACFSPNGHLYIATNAKLPGKPRYQTIWYHSALNGHQFGVIPVLAEQAEDDDPAEDRLSQELEGICFGNVIAPNGQPAQIHAVLLENRRSRSTTSSSSHSRRPRRTWFETFSRAKCSGMAGSRCQSGRRPAERGWLFLAQCQHGIHCRRPSGRNVPDQCGERGQQQDRGDHRSRVERAEIEQQRCRQLLGGARTRWRARARQAAERGFSSTRARETSRRWVL